jgi:hypothetical protein
MVAAISVEATDEAPTIVGAGLQTGDASGAFIDLHAALAEELTEAGGLPVADPVPLKPVPAGFWRFRTKPGYGGTAIHVRVYVDHPVPELNIRRKNAWERSMKREYGDDWKKVLAPDKKLFDKTGLTTIPFERVGIAQECQFVTDDAMVAEYIRYRLSDHPHIYEEVQPMMVDFGNGPVRVMPVDDAGRQAFARAQAGR